MEKKEEKKPEPKVKKKYRMTVEGFSPVIIAFDVWAEDEEEAYKALKNPRLLRPVQPPQFDLLKMVMKKVSIKDVLTSIVKLVKSL